MWEAKPTVKDCVVYGGGVEVRPVDDDWQVFVHQAYCNACPDSVFIGSEILVYDGPPVPRKLDAPPWLPVLVLVDEVGAEFPAGCAPRRIRTGLSGTFQQQWLELSPGVEVASARSMRFTTSDSSDGAGDVPILAPYWRQPLDYRSALQFEFRWPAATRARASEGRRLPSSGSLCAPIRSASVDPRGLPTTVRSIDGAVLPAPLHLKLLPTD